MTEVKARQMTKAPGRRAGHARAQRLTAADRSRIAALGGRSRQRAPDAARRIVDTLEYAAAVRELGTRTRKVKRMKTSKGRLPGIYPDKGSIVGRR
jgi:hypothetical protein